MNVDIPREIHLHILSYLNYRELLIVGRVSKSHFECTKDDSLWLPMYVKEFKREKPSSLISSRTSSWEQVYLLEKALEMNWLRRGTLRGTRMKSIEFDHFAFVDDNFPRYFGYSCTKMHRSQQDPDLLVLYASLSKTVFHTTLNLNGRSAENNHKLVNKLESNTHVLCTEFNANRLGVNRLLSSGQDSVLSLWNLDTGDRIHTIDKLHARDAWSIKMMDDRNVVTCGTEPTVKIFDLNSSTNTPVQTFVGHGSTVYDVACIKEGPSTDLIYSGSSDSSICVFDRRAGSDCVMKTNSLHPIYEVECSQAEKSHTLLAATERGVVTMMDLRKLSTDPESAVEHWNLFARGAIRGLKYNGRRLIVGGTASTVIAVNSNETGISVDTASDEYTQMLIDAKVDQQSSTFTIVNAGFSRDVMSMQVDEEIMLIGTSKSEMKIFDFREELKERKQRQKCSIQ